MTVLDPKNLAASVPMSSIVVRLPEVMRCPVCAVQVGVPCRDQDGRPRIPHMVAVIPDSRDRPVRRSRRK